MANIYFDRIQNLVIKNLTDKEYNGKVLEIVEDALRTDDEEARWFINHWDGSVDVLFETELTEEQVAEIIEDAEKEIALYRKYGRNEIANRWEELLAEYNEQ